MGLFDKLRSAAKPTDHAHAHGADPTKPPAPGLAFDPVCRMWLDPKTSVAQSEHAGRTVHFCAAGCKRAFDAAPERFVSRLPPP